MSLDAYLAVGASLGALAVMIAGVSAERALLAALAALVLTGVVSPGRALSGFSNEGMATVALLFVVAEGVRRSGALAFAVGRVLGAPGALWRAVLRLIVPTASASAFLNNTPIVVMLLPEVRRWGADRGFAPSKLLIPLSYGTIVGGMCTLIGTSTNLLVDGMLVERGQEHLGIFWISAVGLPAAIAALVVIAALGPRVLPSRVDPAASIADAREYTAEFTVDPRGPLDGKPLGSVTVPGLQAFAPVELRRGDGVIAAPRPDELLQGGDRLVFAAPSAEILAVHRLPGLSPAHDPPIGASAGASRRGPRGVLVEAVVGPRCKLIGREVGDGSFRAHYGAAVIAVIRDGARKPPEPLGRWELEVGDVVLLETVEQFVDRHRQGAELALITHHGRARPIVPWHAPFAMVAVAGMAAAAAAGVAPMLTAALAAACLLLVGGVLGWADAGRAIEPRVLLAIVAALGLGAALEDTGAASTLAHALVGVGGDSPWLTLALVYAATAICTELVTNNAAAVLLLPISLSAAADLDASPLPFIAAVMIAASASFLTPIGYQTNLMVYGAGGYRVSDFLRLGVPVAIVVAATTIGLAPVIWPF